MAGGSNIWLLQFFDFWPEEVLVWVLNRGSCFRKAVYQAFGQKSDKNALKLPSFTEFLAKNQYVSICSIKVNLLTIGHSCGHCFNDTGCMERLNPYKLNMDTFSTRHSYCMSKLGSLKQSFNALAKHPIYSIHPSCRKPFNCLLRKETPKRKFARDQRRGIKQ